MKLQIHTVNVFVKVRVFVFYVVAVVVNV